MLATTKTKATGVMIYINLHNLKKQLHELKVCK